MSTRPRILALIRTLSAVGLAATAQGQDVDVELRQFGVGSAFRPGDIAAIRLSLTSALDEPTPCWVQWEVPNAEGDVAEYGRSVTLSPGARALVWLYAPLPPNTTGETMWTVRVFEERDGRRRRELGGGRINPSLAKSYRHEINQSLIAVVGRNKMGLDEYGNPGGPWRATHPPGAHEDTRIVSGITPAELPDRWEGLKAFEAIAWSNALPQELRLDAANALRGYVRRGGHLLVTLPQAGNPWGLGAVGQTYLDDLLVQQAPRKVEGVRLSELISVLSKSDRIRRDIELDIRVFKKPGGFDAIDNHYEPLIALPDGRVIAIQRTFGFGRITIIGIDLASQQLSSMRLPQGDAFWNRILGRRGDTPQLDELIAMENEKERVLTRGSANPVVISDSRVFERHINKTREAGWGLLGAVGLFAAYLLLAGPGGFYLLRQRGHVRHSWLAFAATAGLFTAIAWGGVSVLRQHGTELRHVTFLDHIARTADDPRSEEPQFQRAVSWASLYLSSYGDVRVSIDSEPQQRDLQLTWAAPEKPPERFPNVDRYLIDVGRNPADYRIPARATATQLYAQWLGALDPAWGGMPREDPRDRVRVRRNGEVRLSGTLLHELPGPLRNVEVIWVGADRTPRLRYPPESDGEQKWMAPPDKQGRDMLNAGDMWAYGEPWYPGTPLSLSTLVADDKTGLATNIYKRYIEEHEGDELFSLPGAGGPRSGLTEPQERKFMEMLGMFGQLTPPKYHRQERKDPQTAVASRLLGRELDLSAWFTRPCLIVIGYLEGPPSPIPLRVDGRPPGGEGLTVVRWIFPLPLDESEVRGSTGEQVR
ncbi:MAG: hypothetical protein ACYS0G_05635 [Planctomycetota bacterium]|jgi:hypothetical protein